MRPSGRERERQAAAGGMVGVGEARKGWRKARAEAEAEESGGRRAMADAGN